MKVSEIRTLNTDELKKRLDDSYRELFNLRFRLATKQLGNYHELRNVRKKIAKIKTVMRERELQ
ncbi:MAG: 50S ribosomal protein L29 [Dehalococcoidia bacterium]